jgi:hypothetical protein
VAQHKAQQQRRGWHCRTGQGTLLRLQPRHQLQLHLRQLQHCLVAMAAAGAMHASAWGTGLGTRCCRVECMLHGTWRGLCCCGLGVKAQQLLPRRGRGQQVCMGDYCGDASGELLDGTLHAAHASCSLPCHLWVMVGRHGCQVQCTCRVICTCDCDSDRQCDYHSHNMTAVHIDCRYHLIQHHCGVAG